MKSFIIRELLFKKVTKNIFAVAGGTIVSQTIAIIFSPVITRIYGPEVFGLLGVFTSLLSILTPLAALSFPMAIVLPRKNEDAASLIKLSFLFGVINSIIVFSIIVLFETDILLALNVSGNSLLLYFLPLTMIFSVFSATVTNVSNRFELFKMQGLSVSLNALFNNVLKISLGLITPTAYVLVAITSFGSLTNALFLYVLIRKNDELRTVSNMVKVAPLKLVEKYKDFAIYRTPQIIINSASQSLPILMLTTFIGAQAAGFFTLAKLVISAPANLIGQSVATVLYPKIATAYNKQQSVVKILVKAHLVIGVVALIPLLLLFFWGPRVFEIVFGAEWNIAGQVASWLAPWLLVSIMARPSVAAIPAIRVQGVYLVYEIVSVFIRFIALYVGYVIDPTILSIVIYFSLANAILDLLLILGVILFSSSQRLYNKKSIY